MKLAKNIPEDIIDYIEYVDGKLFWKKTPPSPKKVDRTGCECGCLVKSTGYRMVGFMGYYYQTHRIVWFIFNGQPDKFMVIDHKNKKKDDNRIENLNITTKSGNAKNQKIRTDNASGFTGVHFCNTINKWIAQVVSDGVNYKLGSFESIDEAIAARQDASRKFKFSKNHGGLL